MKAYMVSGSNPDKGNGIVFAENANQARVLASMTDACEDDRYIDVRAKRLPKADKHYRGKPVGDWCDMDLRETLVKEYSWYCIEPNKEECRVCKLCEEVEE